MGAALDLLERDSVLRDGLGPELFEAYLAVRRYEDERFRAEDEDFELRRHFNVF
jgi:glutamine synthetase